MSKTRVVVVCVLLLNAGLLIGLFLKRRAESEAAEARAAVAARATTFRQNPGMVTQFSTAEMPSGLDPEESREIALRSQSKNNLRTLALAMHNYAGAHNAFPAGTHPNADLEPEKRLSWIADVLPYLDQSRVFQSIDFTKSWNDPVHERLTQLNLPLLHTPAMVDGTVVPGGITQYVGIGGVGADAPMLPVTDRRAGAFGYNRVTTIADIKDGTSSTILVTEANKDFGPWIAGGRSTIRSLTTKPYINGPDGIGGPFKGIVHAAIADGSVRVISENIDPAILEALSTINGGEPIPQ